MDIKTINEKLAEIFRDDIGLDRPISPGMKLAEDVGLDSLDRVKVAIKAEEVFNVDMDDDEIDHWQTVGDIANSILKQVQE